MRRAARKDGNHREIVSGLRSIPGCTVYDIERPLDLLVGFRGRNYLLEVKDQKGKVSPSQAEFMQLWRGQVGVVRTLRDALFILGVIK